MRICIMPYNILDTRTIYIMYNISFLSFEFDFIQIMHISLLNSDFSCLQLIFSGEYTKAMNKDWHSGHFCCWQCDESLTGQRYVLRDEHPYCIKCYESVFANGCEECNKIIGIDSKVMNSYIVVRNRPPKNRNSIPKFNYCSSYEPYQKNILITVLRFLGSITRIFLFLNIVGYNLFFFRAERCLFCH